MRQCLCGVQRRCRGSLKCVVGAAYTIKKRDDEEEGKMFVRFALIALESSESMAPFPWLDLVAI